MKNIFIDKREIGENCDPLVIVEIGINHGGDIEVAKQMVTEAYKSGAEVIKHQTHVVEDEMSREALNVVPGNSDKSIYSIMAESALTDEEERQLMRYVEDLGMIYLSTPFSRAAAIKLNAMGVKAFKIGSGECNNYPLIEHVASYGKPMIVSTGMNTIESVSKTVAILEKSGVDYALLHTTNLYPTPPELVRLGGMLELQENFPESVTGLSDHTTSNLSCFAAVALGAKILERHFTDHKYRKGPDIVNSMDGQELRELIYGANEITKMIGGNKEPAQEEEVTINFAFASVVSIRSIKKGEKFTSENIWVKRPGNGDYSAEEYPFLIGKKASKDIKDNIQISKSHVEK